MLLEPDGDELLRVSGPDARGGRPGSRVGMPITTTVPARRPADGGALRLRRHAQRASADMAALAEVLGTDSGLAVVVPGRTAARGSSPWWRSAPRGYTDDEVDFARAFAGLSSAALHRMEAEEELAEVAEERGALLDRLVSAQEDERGGSPTACTRTRSR